MKNVKYVAAAVALAVSGGANAAILNGAGYLSPSQAPGEMFIVVLDESNTQSFFMDLGVTTDAFKANADAGSYSFDLGAVAGGLFANSGLVYNIAAVNTDDKSLFYTTATSFDGSSLGNYNYSTGSAKISQMADYINSGDTNYAANNYGIRMLGENGYGGASYWGSSMGGAFSFSTFVDVGADSAFYTTVPYGRGVAGSQFAHNWNLSTDGLLTYNAVSAVPVPAAVWLFGSGLVGLVGVARRRVK